MQDNIIQQFVRQSQCLLIGSNKGNPTNLFRSIPPPHNQSCRKCCHDGGKGRLWLWVIWQTGCAGLLFSPNMDILLRPSDRKFYAYYFINKSSKRTHVWKWSRKKLFAYFCQICILDVKYLSFFHQTEVDIQLITWAARKKCWHYFSGGYPNGFPSSPHNLSYLSIKKSRYQKIILSLYWERRTKPFHEFLSLSLSRTWSALKWSPLNIKVPAP